VIVVRKGPSRGLVIWLAYRPSLEQSSHHLIGVLALPWVVVAAAIVLAIVATYLAASRPARSITRLSVMDALSGRPAPPKQVHRSALPGIVFLVVAFLLLGYSGGASAGSGSVGTPELVLGIVALIPGSSCWPRSSSSGSGGSPGTPRLPFGSRSVTSLATGLARPRPSPRSASA
jgi:putative ABC transport system permease protein